MLMYVGPIGHGSGLYSFLMNSINSIILIFFNSERYRGNKIYEFVHFVLVLNCPRCHLVLFCTDGVKLSYLLYESSTQLNFIRS